MFLFQSQITLFVKKKKKRLQLEKTEIVDLNLERIEKISLKLKLGEKISLKEELMKLMKFVINLMLKLEIQNRLKILSS